MYVPDIDIIFNRSAPVYFASPEIDPVYPLTEYCKLRSPTVNLEETDGRESTPLEQKPRGQSADAKARIFITTPGTALVAGSVNDNQGKNE